MGKSMPRAGAAVARRDALKTLATAGAALAVAGATGGSWGTAKAAGRFFTVAERDGRWWFVTPDGERFWSIGMNHIDSAALRYPDSGGVWEEQFGNSQERWLRAVAADLHHWGFNTIGWTQEVVIITDGYHRHSRALTYEEYQWAGLPYCHLLPFTEAHQWQVEVRMPDLTSPDFDEWCDYVARDECVRLRDDPKLIGYFYCDCPQWVHTSPDTEWRGSLVDPGLLESRAGRRELSTIAERYYRVTREAIRRYDPHHLILGDRWEANAPLPEEVVRAALPHVDVLSFQCFGTVDNIATKMGRWADFTNRPVLLADAAGHIRAPGDTSWPPTADRKQDGDHYRQTMDALWRIPQSVGYHLCGAYIQNHARRYGFRDRTNTVIPETMEGIRAVNADIQKRIRG